jgi:hypothetical protein
MLQLSDPDDNSNDGSYSDSNDFEIEEAQVPSPPNSTSAKPKLKLNLRASDADRSTGLFKFFPTIPHDEHLKLVWKPAPALKDREQQELVRYQRRLDIFEKTARKRERATERKRKQRAREKATKEVSMYRLSFHLNNSHVVSSATVDRFSSS